MLIDEVLPDFDESERHEVRVSASPERSYAAVRGLNLSQSFVIRALFTLRGLPGLFSRRPRTAPLGLTLETLIEGGFVLLAEKPGEEIVLGLVGQFWKPTGAIRRVSAGEFKDLAAPGLAKAAWNFQVSRDGAASMVSTETRVKCTDEKSLRSFRRYWRLVRPFSGWIRNEALRAIRRSAETE